MSTYRSRRDPPSRPPIKVQSSAEALKGFVQLIRLASIGVGFIGVVVAFLLVREGSGVGFVALLLTLVGTGLAVFMMHVLADALMVFLSIEANTQASAERLQELMNELRTVPQEDDGVIEEITPIGQS